MPCILFCNLFSVALGEKKLLKYMYDTYLSLYNSKFHYKVSLRPDDVFLCSAVEFGSQPASCGIISRKYTSFGEGIVHTFGGISCSGMPPISTGDMSVVPICQITFYFNLNMKVRVREFSLSKIFVFSYLSIFRLSDFAFDFILERVHIFMREEVVAMKVEALCFTFDSEKLFEAIVAIQCPQHRMIEWSLSIKLGMVNGQSDPR